MSCLTKQYKISIVGCNIQVLDVCSGDIMNFTKICEQGINFIVLGGCDTCAIQQLRVNFSEIINPTLADMAAVVAFIQAGLVGCVPVLVSSCYEHIQAVAATTWLVPHNTGIMYPCGWNMFGPLDQTLLANVEPQDANNLSVFFGFALSGRIKLLFI